MASEELDKTIESVGRAFLLFTKTWLGAAVMMSNQPEAVFLVTGTNAIRQRILVDGYWVPVNAVKVLAYGNSTIDLAKFEEELRRRVG